MSHTSSNGFYLLQPVATFWLSFYLILLYIYWTDFFKLSNPGNGTAAKRIISFPCKMETANYPLINFMSNLRSTTAGIELVTSSTQKPNIEDLCVFKKRDRERLTLFYIFLKNWAKPGLFLFIFVLYA